MSEIRVDNIIGENGLDAVNFSKGVSAAGIVTATGFKVGTGISMTDTGIKASNFYGNGAALSGIAGGITEVDCWRIHTTFQGGANPITSNWERFDTAGEEKLGTGMSESSGVFSFPSTGYWEIMFHSNFYSGGDHRTCILYLKVSTDGGSNYVYNTDGYGDLYWGNSGNGYQSAEATQILKVTSTTNYKLTFAVSTDPSSSVYWIGGSTQNQTYVIFKKLADV